MNFIQAIPSVLRHPPRTHYALAFPPNNRQQSQPKRRQSSLSGPVQLRNRRCALTRVIAAQSVIKAQNMSCLPSCSSSARVRACQCKRSTFGSTCLPSAPAAAPCVIAPCRSDMYPARGGHWSRRIPPLSPASTQEPSVMMQKGLQLLARADAHTHTHTHLSSCDLRHVALALLNQMAHKRHIIEVHRKVQQPARYQ